MPVHDFRELHSQYPNIIAQMPDTFTSHQFILKLAHQNQPAYIEALYSYREYNQQGSPAQFQIVHRILAQRLSSFPELVTLVHESVPSIDIFGQKNNCSVWRKV